MAEYIDRTKLKEDSEYNPVSGEYLSYSRGQIWNAPVEKVIDISVLDKIRAEIANYQKEAIYSDDIVMTKHMILAIIDKYKAESEDEG